MRVAHVITGLGQGGAERMLTRIASGGGGATPLVVSLTDAGVFGADLRDAGVEVATLGMRRRGGADAVGAVRRLARLLRSRRIDCVMTWLYHADLVGSLATLAAGLDPRRRLVWNLRCTELDFSRHPAGTRRTMTMLRRLSRLPAAVAANSSAGASDHARLGYRPRRWALLPNGLDLDQWPLGAPDPAARAALGLPADGRLIGFVGRNDPQKDLATFFAAAAAIADAEPDIRFALVGDGVERLRPPLAVAERAVLLGLRRDVPALMGQFDALALSSAYGEGFPNVLLEAMACGAPCATTDVGDAAAIVGPMGRVAAVGDAVALAAGLRDLVAGPAEARAARRAAVRAHVAARYDIARVRALYAALFESLDASAAEAADAPFFTPQDAPRRAAQEGAEP